MKNQMSNTTNPWVVYSYCKQLSQISPNFEKLTGKEKVSFLEQKFPHAGKAAIMEGVAEFEAVKRKMEAV